MSEQEDSDFDTKEDYHNEYYGIIDKLEGNTCHARIYTVSTDELIELITFDKNSFPKDEREKVKENIVFLWSYGYKKGVAYCDFKLKQIIPETQEQRAKRLKETQEIIEYLEKCNNEVK